MFLPEESHDRGAGRATVRGVAKSWTRQKRLSTCVQGDLAPSHRVPEFAQAPRLPSSKATSTFIAAASDSQDRFWFPAAVVVNDHRLSGLEEQVHPRWVSLVRIQVSGGLFLSEPPGRTVFPAFLPPGPACTRGFLLLPLLAGTSGGALLSSRPLNPDCHAPSRI